MTELLLESRSIFGSKLKSVLFDSIVWRLFWKFKHSMAEGKIGKEAAKRRIIILCKWKKNNVFRFRWCTFFFFFFATPLSPFSELFAFEGEQGRKLGGGKGTFWLIFNILYLAYIFPERGKRVLCCVEREREIEKKKWKIITKRWRKKKEANAAAQRGRRSFVDLVNRSSSFKVTLALLLFESLY